jgi:hypothetical protein
MGRFGKMKGLSNQKRKELKKLAEEGLGGLGPGIDLSKVEDTTRRLSEVLAGHVKAVASSDSSKRASKRAGQETDPGSSEKGSG